MYSNSPRLNYDRQSSPLESLGICLLTATLSILGTDNAKAVEPRNDGSTTTQTFTNRYGQQESVTTLSEREVDKLYRERDTKVIIVPVETDSELERIQKFAHVVMLNQRQLNAGIGMESLLKAIEEIDHEYLPDGNLRFAFSHVREKTAELLEQRIKNYEITTKVWRESKFVKACIEKDPSRKEMFESSDAIDHALIEQSRRLKSLLTNNADWVTRSEDRLHSAPGLLAAQLMKEYHDINKGFREGIGNLTGAYGGNAEVVFAVTSKYKDVPWRFNQTDPPSRLFNGTRYYFLRMEPANLSREIAAVALDSEEVPLPNFQLGRNFLEPLTEEQVKALGRLGTDGERVFEWLVEEAATEAATMGFQILLEVITH